MEYIESLLRFAESLAEKARLETLKLFRQNASVEIKADASPVTVADRNSEAAMREMIAGAYPTHGVIGEEFGADYRRLATVDLRPHRRHAQFYLRQSDVLHAYRFCARRQTAYRFD